MADKDEKNPTQAQIEANEQQMKELEDAIAEQQRVAEREEVERQARGFPGSPVASRSVDGPSNPITNRLAAMEAAGAPKYLIDAEKRSMEANRKAWSEQLRMARSRGAPEPPMQTIIAPEAGMEMLTAAQQERDAILLSQMELHMENPPKRSGMTLEEHILNEPDETIPGGFYIVNGQAVNASGQVLAG